MATRLRVMLLLQRGKPETTAEGAERRASEAARAVFRIFRDVDDRMSEWKQSSPLAAVNRAAGGEPVAVPDELRRLLHRALDIARLTDGAFDPTWAALWGLWDFRAAEPRVPDAEEVARRAALVDWTQVEIDDSAGTVRLSEPGMMLGLGGIAKGWALDRSAKELRRRGVRSFLLTAGGQVMAGGLRDTDGGHTAEGRRPWRVGIRDPRGRPDDFFARVPVTDASLSTSGDYESFFVVDGVRYHHILDPRTGWPARGLRSATVISPDATLADALSTALMVMGAERGMELVERLPPVEAVLVDEAGATEVSRGLEGRLDVRHPPRP
jgi:thiamine biosynthesis lipoprotein